jgi:hypothetical protein
VENRPFQLIGRKCKLLVHSGGKLAFQLILRQVGPAVLELM